MQQIHIRGATYDTQAMARRIARGVRTVPGTDQTLTNSEREAIVKAAETLGWEWKHGRLFYRGVNMAPGSHRSSSEENSQPSTHSGSETSVGTDGWMGRGYDAATAKRLHRRERRVRRWGMPSKDTNYSRGYYSTHSNSSSDNSSEGRRIELLRDHASRYPRHRCLREQNTWEDEKVAHLQQRARRQRVHIYNASARNAARAELLRRGLDTGAADLVVQKLHAMQTQRSKNP